MFRAQEERENMPRGLAASVVVSFVSLVSLVSLCACESTPQPTQVASIPACEGSAVDGCRYGKPLCAADNDGACLMCRCTAYEPLTGDVRVDGSGFFSTGNSGTPVSGSGFGPR